MVLELKVREKKMRVAAIIANVIWLVYVILQLIHWWGIVIRHPSLLLDPGHWLYYWCLVYPILSICAILSGEKGWIRLRRERKALEEVK